MAEAWLSWREATERALYGPDGFYRQQEPAGHFTTSVNTSPLFAEAVLSLARSAALRTVIDLGSGGGELLSDLHELDPDLELAGVDVAPRPPHLPAAIDWRPELPVRAEALVIANEWLDNVPVNVAVATPDGVRLVDVEVSTGAERAGGPPSKTDLRWLEQWWPSAGVGDRAEIGHPRDRAWASVIASLRRGVAVAVDYSHDRSQRPAGGSLVGYRSGSRVLAVPDGTCDITSHVALDACAAAGRAAGADWTVLTTQRAALSALAGPATKPPYDLASSAPATYLAELARASQLAELTRRDGLGDFGWLVQGVGAVRPTVLAGLVDETAARE